MGLLDTLGLDQVESDPNHIPAKEVVPGVISKSEYVKTKKETLAHVITYKAVEPSKHKGKEQAEWFTLGTPEYNDEGALTKLTPTMSEQAKSFYKRRLETLGVTDTSAFKPKDLIGLDVNFSVRHSNGFQNIAFAELRTSEGDVNTSPDAESGGFTAVDLSDL